MMRGARPRRPASRPRTSCGSARPTSPTPLVPRERVARRHRARSTRSARCWWRSTRTTSRRQAQALVEAGCDAFAICFLWSIQNPAHERARPGDRRGRRARRVRQRLIRRSPSAVGEYERTVAAVVNAFVGPEHLALPRQARAAGSASSASSERSDAHAVPRRHGAAEHGTRAPDPDDRLRARSAAWSAPSGSRQELGHRRRDRHRHGRHQLRRRHRSRTASPSSRAETVIDKYTYQHPRRRGALDRRRRRLDRLDRASTASTLRVGPAERELATRARPATASAAQEPTVTDADLVLGYLDPEAVFGTSGEGQIRPTATWPTRRSPGSREPLGLTRHRTRRSGIVEIVDAKMANLLENVVVGRGFDPRDFTIFSFGGSGRCTPPATPASSASQKVHRPRRGRLGLERASASRSPTSATRARRDVQLVSPIDAGELEEVYDGLEAELLRARSPRRAERRARAAPLRAACATSGSATSSRSRSRRASSTTTALDRGDRRLRGALRERYGSAALLPDARFEIVNVRVEALHADRPRRARRTPSERRGRRRRSTRGRWPSSAASEPAGHPGLRRHGLAAGREIERPGGDRPADHRASWSRPTRS